MNESTETALAVMQTKLDGVVQTVQRVESATTKNTNDISDIKTEVATIKTRIAGWGAAAAIVGPIIFALITKYIQFGR